MDLGEGVAVGHDAAEGFGEEGEGEVVGEGFHPVGHGGVGEEDGAEEEHGEDDEVSEDGDGVDGFGESGDGEAESEEAECAEDHDEGEEEVGAVDGDFEVIDTEEDEEGGLGDGHEESGDDVGGDELPGLHGGGHEAFEDAFFAVLGKDEGDGEDGHLHDGHGDDAGEEEFDVAEVVGGDGFFVDGEKGRDVVDEEGGFVGELVDDGEGGGGVLGAAFVGVDGEFGGGR